MLLTPTFTSIQAILGIALPLNIYRTQIKVLNLSVKVTILLLVFKMVAVKDGCLFSLVYLSLIILTRSEKWIPKSENVLSRCTSLGYFALAAK